MYDASTLHVLRPVNSGISNAISASAPLIRLQDVTKVFPVLSPTMLLVCDVARRSACAIGEKQRRKIDVGGAVPI
ncbi:hypothetical protein BG74_00430 [Sodalis-like endosymbiont of Proechinophthirus fluctus]|nr:hypothetical protein BG74_00430 [Sodalis-like endosymbiont of Proechinophthirus fluctus]